MSPSNDSPPARVLLAEESVPYRRVIREALMSFRHCEVDDCPTGERAFELALSRPRGGGQQSAGARVEAAHTRPTKAAGR